MIDSPVNSFYGYPNISFMPFYENRVGFSSILETMFTSLCNVWNQKISDPDVMEVIKKNGSYFNTCSMVLMLILHKIQENVRLSFVINCEFEF